MEVILWLNSQPLFVVWSIFGAFVVLCFTLIKFMDSLSNWMFPPHVRYGMTKEFLKRMKGEDK